MALTFNGSDDYLSLATAITSGSPLVISAWVRQPNSVSNHAIAEVGTGGGNNRFSLTVNSGEGVEWRVRQFGNATSVGTSGEIGDDTWNHVLAWSNTTSDHGIWVDANTTATSTGTQSVSATQTEIGVQTGGSDHWDGELAEVAFWGMSIAGEELAFATALAAGYSPLFYPYQLLAYLPMINDTSDLMGNVWTENGTGGFPTFPHPPIIYPAPQDIIIPAAAVAGRPQGPLRHPLFGPFMGPVG